MDVENANCKLKISECTDLEITPIERPLKCDVTILDLDHLLDELYRLFSQEYVNVHLVKKLMGSYKSSEREWKKYAKFDRFRYTRNLVSEGNGAFNIMILCWGPGHASGIHDHADSHCFMKMLKGNLEEVRYDWPNAATHQNGDESTDRPTRDEDEQYSGEPEKDVQEMVETKRTRLEINDVCYINDALGLHRMENPSHVDGAVSLHLYCPPFDTCRVFDGRTGNPKDVKVTFWSKFGNKVKLIDTNGVAK